MPTTAIKLGDGHTVPITPPASALGDAFTQIITLAAGWDDATLHQVNTHYETWGEGFTDTDAYNDAINAVGQALIDAGLEWSPTFGQPGAPAEAGPYVDTLAATCDGAAEVAATLLARDLGLVTAADFDILTHWWVAYGLPLPDPGPAWPGFLDPAGPVDTDVQLMARTEHLANTRGKVADWPLAALTHN